MLFIRIKYISKITSLSNAIEQIQADRIGFNPFLIDTSNNKTLNKISKIFTKVEYREANHPSSANNHDGPPPEEGGN